jgi:Predicted Zn-dependent hydrolases of the beta-lactamase fold
MSKITFINHSSVLTEDNGTKILCDPWFKGTAFQDGWSLLHENSHNINEIDFNYIWISHEHPDHFSIATLLDINKPTTFLYQETKDKKVKNFLEKKGHMVIELKDSCPTIIDDTEVTLFISDGYDSALLFRFSDGKNFFKC